ncbi:MAG: APC family permease [Actinobacteria bacterium]|nr:APC family permease [Actinomycetota bacterium]MBI3686288.1 APC family permease [Actinomycetota bacterium]
MDDLTDTTRSGPSWPGLVAHPPRLRHPSVGVALARDRLGVPAVVFFVLAQVAPLTVAAGVLPTFWAVTGITGAPIVFAAVALVLAVFCVGYLGLARAITHAGGIYAFTTRGLGRPAGVGTALVAVGTYELLQVALYGMFGPATSGLVTDLTGRIAPWWVYSLLAWAVVAVLGVRDVRLSGRLLAVLSAGEILLLLVLSVAGLTHPAGSGVDMSTLNPTHLLAPGIGAALVIAVLAFVGFEGAPVLSEETRHPQRTVPAATYTALAVMNGVYVLVSWAMATHYGPTHLAAVAGEQGPMMLFTLAGPTFVQVGQVLFVTSLLAAALAFHNAVNRITFTLGRDHLLPIALGWTGRRGGAPWVASLTQTTLGLLVIVGYAVSGSDPIVQLFYTAGTTGGLGVLLLITIVSLAITTHHLRTHTPLRAVLPATATLILGVMSWLAVTGFPTLLGVPDTAVIGWLLPGGYLVLASIGLLLAQRLRRTDSTAYTTLGASPTGSTPPAGVR